MSRWKIYLIVSLAMVIGASGCGGKSSTSSVILNISPASSSVITNTTLQFSSSVTGSTNTTVTWTISCATGVTAPACGTIDTNGLYSAPKTIPTTTANGTTTIAPTAVITATPQADTSKLQTARITIISGISITILPTTATVGTGEHFTFAATVNNPGCNTTINPTCLNVTWSVPANTTGAVGSIDANGVYTAPTPAPSPSTVTITATSVADTAVTATASVTVETAVTPTLTSVSPNAAGLGGLFQDIYITGTNFISTNNVFINGAQLGSNLVEDISSSVIRARIPDFILAAPPSSGLLQIGVSEQTGTPQTCADASKCQVAVTGVRPGVAGPSPDSISQGTAGVLNFNIDGGFFGTGLNPNNPAVSATYAGQPRGIQLPASGSTNSTRQLSVTIGGSSNSSDFTTPGLYPVAIQNAVDPTKFAVTNLAVQPNYTSAGNSISTIAARIAVGSVPASSSPADVAINPATGMAVVANTMSNDVSLIDLTAAPPVVVATICTASVGAALPCPSSGPTSVSVDYVRNIALVANTASKTIAVVDLSAKAVTYVTPPLQDPPGAVGINPVTGRALVAIQTRGYGVLMDVTKNPPAFIGTVSISTGPHTRVAVEPHLNWAIATPGLLGSVGIVDLNRQTVNNITNLSRTTNVVTVTVQPSTPQVPQSPLAVQPGGAVQIQGASDNSFNGIYQVTAIGPGATQFAYTQTGAALTDLASFTTAGTVNYSDPVATVGLTTSVQGIGINTETEQAVLVDPTSNGVVSFFSLIDQSVFSMQLRTGSAAEPGTIAAAFNSMTNTAVTVNSLNHTLSVIDPTTPVRLTKFTLPNPDPVAVALDPSTNIAVVANQTDNSVTVLSLGAIQSFSIAESSPKTFTADSTLTSAPVPSALTLTIIGKGLTCVNNATNLTVRLDRIALQTLCTGDGDRKLTAIVPPSLLSSPRRFALDVLDSSGAVTNAEDFTVQQSIDVTGCSATPYPSGVAIDAQQNIAAVSLAGCNSLALINLSNGTGQTVAVGSNPLGVAVIPRLHLAVVANNVSNTASVVDELGASVKSTISTGAGPIGVAADPDTGEAAVANSVANTVSIINVASGGSRSITTGQRPIAVAFNYQNHQVAIATTGATAFNTGTVSFADAGAGSTTSSFSVNTPTSVIYDPWPGDCPASNTVGCYLANSSTNNNADILDPTTSTEIPFRIGINPTAIAYNYLTSTLVSTNTASHTVTVADFLAKRIRAILTLPAPVNSNLTLTGALQFALDIHPLTNLAVIADTANGRVLLVPLPR
jgi:hypothetical protein